MSDDRGAREHRHQHGGDGAPAIRSPPRPVTDAVRVAVLDDEQLNRRLFQRVFTAAGLGVAAWDTGARFLAELEPERFDVVILDLRLPDTDGLAVLRELHARTPELPVIVVTAHGDVPTAVEALKCGAYDFLTRPVGNDVLVSAIRRAAERRRLQAEVTTLRSRLASDALRRMIGTSPAITAVVRDLQRVARAALSVLVVGETGTGKELVARAIHQASARAGHGFVAVDCGAMPDPLFEAEMFGNERGAFTGAERAREGHIQSAHGGTLFLDELANLTPANQSKLLRVLQEREVRPVGARHTVPVDIRVVAASQEHLDRRGSGFRGDLYYRIAEFVVRVPPLRERGDDVLTIADHFLAEAALELRCPASNFSPAAHARLARHPWPGNVRELRNVVRQLALRADGPQIEEAEVAQVLRGRGPVTVPPPAAPRSLREVADAATAEAEQRAIAAALRAAHGNKAEAARQLQVDYKTLHVKLKRYGLGAGDD